MEVPDATAGGADSSVAERLGALATWVNDIEARLRVAELTAGDEKTARELRKALEALARHDPKLEKRVTDHVTVVTERFDTLASTVSTTAAGLAAREGEIAGLRREVEDAEKRLEQLARRSGGGADAKELARIRGIVDALPAQRPAGKADGRVDELGATMRMLAERVDSLTTTVSANASALGRRDKELVAVRDRVEAGTQKVELLAAELRRLERDDSLAERMDALQLALADREREADGLRARIDEAYSRIGDAVAELQRSVGELTTEMDDLRTAPHAAAAVLEQRAGTLDGRIDEAAARLETIAADVETGLAERDAQLTGLYRDVEAERARVDALFGELRAVVDALPDPAAGDAALEARLSGVERERAETAERLRRADENWLQERDWVRRQLERLAEAHEQTTRAAASVEPALGELRAGLHGLTAEREALSERVEAHEARQVTVEDRLDAAEPHMAAVASELAESSAQTAAALAERLDALERRREAAPNAELVARLEEVTARLARVESAAQSAAAAAAVAAAASPEERFGEVRALVDGVVARMASIEHEVASGTLGGELADVRTTVAGVIARVTAVEEQAATSAPHEDALASLRSAFEGAVARVNAAEETAAGVRRTTEALAKRVEAAERASRQPGAAAGDLGVQGGGRFRLELRALDLRMEHAETAARENREAVLTQLERLASRVEWRLQRLEEAAQAESVAEPEQQGAQIVPIRGGADAS